MLHFFSCPFFDHAWDKKADLLPGVTNHLKDLPNRLLLEQKFFSELGVLHRQPIIANGEDLFCDSDATHGTLALSFTEQLVLPTLESLHACTEN